LGESTVGSYGKHGLSKSGVERTGRSLKSDRRAPREFSWEVNVPLPSLGVPHLRQPAVRRDRKDGFAEVSPQHSQPWEKSYPSSSRQFGREVYFSSAFGPVVREAAVGSYGVQLVPKACGLTLES
jgi:hypothetical protein